jgi:hypothetical protein
LVIRSNGHLDKISKMRLLIATPRKSGNAQLRCLLASAYGLELINSRYAPDGSDFAEIAAWLGELPERSVVHTSFRYTPQLKTLATKLGITLVAVLRHPFDLFVTIYDVAQHRADKKEPKAGAAVSWVQLAGREIDHPDVMKYLREGFSEEIDWLREWRASGVPALRFERLEADPFQALSGLTTHLGPVDDDAVEHAVANCPAEKQVRTSPVRGRPTPIPVVPTGAWRERLSDDHVSILRDRYGDDVRQLGYELI